MRGGERGCGEGMRGGEGMRREEGGDEKAG